MADVLALYESAGNATAQSLEAFYNSFDHPPPIQTYSVSYVVEHHEELKDKELYVEGYISAVLQSKEKHEIRLVESADAVTGKRYDGDYGFALESVKLIEEKKAFLVVDVKEITNPKYELGDYIVVFCKSLGYITALGYEIIPGEIPIS